MSDVEILLCFKKGLKKLPSVLFTPPPHTHTHAHARQAVVVRACNPSSQDIEAGELVVKGQPLRYMGEEED